MEIEADCPASGQPALGLASGPGIGCPRKNQTRPLEHSKPLDNCSLNWLPEQDVAGGLSLRGGCGYSVGLMEIC